MLRLVTLNTIIKPSASSTHNNQGAYRLLNRGHQPKQSRRAVASKLENPNKVHMTWVLVHEFLTYKISSEYKGP